MEMESKGEITQKDLLDKVNLMILCVTIVLLIAQYF